MRSTTLYGTVIALAAAAGSLTALQTAGAQPHRPFRTNESPLVPAPAAAPAPAETPDPAPAPAPPPALAATRSPLTTPDALLPHMRVAPTPAPAPRVRTTALAGAPTPRVRSSSRTLLYPHVRSSSRTPAPELLAPPAPPAPPAAPPPAPAPAVAQAAPSTPPPAPPAPPASSPGTPLLVRTSHAIELAPPPRGTGAGAAFLVLFVGAAVGLGYWLRRSGAARASNGFALKILQRAPIGVRSELLVVDVDGQRHLLGVTPSSVQHLASLDEAEGRAPQGEGSPAEPIVSRFEAMLDAARESSPPREPERRARPASPASPRRPSIARREVEEQARGLLDLGN